MSAAPFNELRNGQGERLDFAFHPGDPEGRCVVVIGHGVTSNKDRPYLIALADALAGAGIAALRITFAGNPGSDGRYEVATPTKEAQDLASVVGALAAAGFGPIAYAGHSMGSAVGLLCTVQAAPAGSIRALVSLAGMFHVASFFERHFGNLAPGAPMLGKPECPWNPALAADAARLGSLTTQAARITIPWLLVHGDDDDMVPLQDSLDARASAGRRPELVMLARADHRFTGAVPEMLAAVVPWLRRTLGHRPPSG